MDAGYRFKINHMVRHGRCGGIHKTALGDGPDGDFRCQAGNRNRLPPMFASALNHAWHSPRLMTCEARHPRSSRLARGWLEAISAPVSKDRSAISCSTTVAHLAHSWAQGFPLDASAKLPQNNHVQNE